MISLSTACLYHLPLDCVFRLAKEAGFDGVELVMGPEVWLRGPDHVARLVERHTLPVLTVHQTLLPASPAGRGAARMAEAARAAARLGAAHVVIHGPDATSWQAEAGQRWLGGLRETRAFLEGTPTRLALENWGLKPGARSRPVLVDLDDLTAFASAEDLDITFDTCHAGMMGLDPLQAYETLRGRLGNVHLSNLRPQDPPLGLQPLRPLFSEHRLPDDGDLALSPMVARLVAERPAVPLTYEISPVYLRAWNPSALRRRLADLVAYVRRHAARPDAF